MRSDSIFPTRVSVAIIIFLSAVFGCTTGQRPGNADEWSESQASEWFDQKEWLGTSSLRPDASIDKQDFAARYHKNKSNWDKAFAFLSTTNLDSLSLGNHEIDGKNVFAIVSEYTSKNPEDAQYESHKIYTDLQSVISGEEYMGLSDLSSTTVKTPYSDEKDIAFYTTSAAKQLLAKPGTFFIFFPDDAHSPGRKVDENRVVRKIVIKVKN
jgi:YhcH/YjgK/YiaL family protein